MNGTRGRVVVLGLAAVGAAAIMASIVRADLLVPAQEPPPDSGATCTTMLSATLSLTPIRTCDEVTVTSRAAAVCPACPGGINVVFLRVAGIQPSYTDWLVETGQDAIREMADYADTTDSVLRVAIVDYGEEGYLPWVRTPLPLTDDLFKAEQEMKSWPWPTNGCCGFEEGAQEALSILRKARLSRQQGQPCEFVIMTLALKEHPGSDVGDLAREMRNAAAAIRRGGPTLMVTCPIGPVYCKTPRTLPSAKRYVFIEPDAGLGQTIREDMDAFTESEGVAELALTHLLPPELTYVDGSARPELDQMELDGSGTALSWRWGQPESDSAQTVAYRARPLVDGPESEGTWRITGTLQVTDRLTRTTSAAMDPLPVTVSGLCAPSPTPTDPPSPSPVPTGTSTATEPAPPTATTTATHVPSRLYLPVTLREHCEPVHERSDIAMVIDTSSSMTGRKIEDARAAALSFVGRIDLAPGRSQVAVVRFDREAEVVQELTNARAVIASAIRSLQVRSGTHIDKGLRAALGELQGPRHNERNAQVLILLTDGVQTGTQGEELRAGDEVRAARIRVYTIGLGADVDEETLREIAGADERYYFAPDSGDLARIYGEIARDLMCPGVDLWGGP